MGCGRIPPSDVISVTEFHKLSTWRSTCSAALQCAWDSAAGRHWHTLPTRLLQYNIDIPAPFLVHLYNSLFHTGSVPMLFKSAYITPLSKSDFDPADPKSYHPVGNLTVLSKLPERLIAWQLVDYLKTAWLLYLNYSLLIKHGTRQKQQVLTDILTERDTGNICTLTILDLLITVDNSVLLQHLATSHGLDGAVLSWLRSYLDSLMQFICCGRWEYGVPQRSVLGLILFLLNIGHLLKLSHVLRPHTYNDDMLFTGSCHMASDVTIQHDSSLSGRRLSVGLQQRSSSTAICQIVCCQDRPIATMETFCSCRSKTEKRPQSTINF